MFILAIVLRVLYLWFAMSFALGLCWAMGCFVAPRIRRWRQRTPQRAARKVGRTARLGHGMAELEPEEHLVDEVGATVVPRPRRFAPQPRPAREVAARSSLPARSASSVSANSLSAGSVSAGTVGESERA